MKFTRSLFVIAALALVASACGDDDDTVDSAESTTTSDRSSQVAGKDDDLAELISLAEAEGELLVYSSQPEGTNVPTAEAFAETYDIDIEILRVRAGDITQRVPAEAAAGATVPDVIQLTDYVWLDDVAEPDGLLRDLREVGIPAYDEYPEEWKSTHRMSVDYDPIIAAYNTERLPEGVEVESLEDLLDPALRGEILFPDPRLSPLWQAVMTTVLDVKGPEFLEDLRPQIRVQEASAAAAEALAAGEGSIAWPMIASAVDAATAAGAPIDVFPLFEPVLGPQFHFAMVEGGAHPYAAALFMNWLMTEDGASVWTKGSSEEFRKASALGECCGIRLPDEYIILDYRAAAEAEADMLAALGL